MGVEGLLKFIRDKHPKGYSEIPISKFKGKRMAIDVSGFMYRNMAVARNSAVKQMDLINKEYDENMVRRIWYSKLVNIFCDLLDAGVLPVIVFDGKGPALKGNERQVRMEKAAKQREEIRAAKEKLDEADELDKPKLVEELRKAYKHDTTIHASDHDLIRIVLNGIGLPCLQSNTEADHLCASLCLYGEVAAVFSADSDILTHGCPLLVTSILNKQDTLKRGYEEKTVTVYHLGNILKSLDMGMATFVDFCIMCGCDYNGHMSGRIKGIGPSKAEKIIKKYLYIEDIPQDVIDKAAKKDCPTDKSIYLAKECREQFSHFPIDELIVEFIEKDDTRYNSDEDDPYASDEEYEDNKDKDNTLGGVKLEQEFDEEEAKCKKINNEQPKIFGNRKNRYHLVSDSDIRTVFGMANIEEKTGAMRNMILNFIEKYEDSGEAGHVDKTYIPKIHRWTPDGKLYIDGELFAEF